MMFLGGVIVGLAINHEPTELPENRQLAQQNCNITTREGDDNGR